MRYYALACDFDGTVAWNGKVDPETVAALRRVRESGRKLILVTGRELDDLFQRFPEFTLFDSIVAENGAIVYRPETGDQRMLGEPPPREFVHDLRERGVEPMSVGEVVIATWHPHDTVVLNAIEQHGLEHHVIFNKGAVMVLPPGVNKATGLVSALHELRLSPRNTVCVGDAENDQSMFRACELAVAVDNALPTVKANADMVTSGDHGTGVIELCDRLIADDLADQTCLLQRHNVIFGRRETPDPVDFQPYDMSVLLAGTAGSGKSTLATGIIERIIALGYQVCVIDPEGDYGTIPEIIHIGDGRHAPSVEEVVQVLEHPPHSVIVNLLALPFHERPAFLLNLCAGFDELRMRTGRPHWLIVDEAHHLLPNWAGTEGLKLPDNTPNLLLLTVDPHYLPSSVLQGITLVIAVDSQPHEILQTYCTVSGRPAPEISAYSLALGEGIAWYPGHQNEPVRFHAIPCHSIHRRHRRKYAEGDMGPERSFYFRGPNDRHNRPARNLIAFIDTADELNDETWLYHLQRGDISFWIRDAIRDRVLSNHVAMIEARNDLTALESRRLVREAIERLYTLPA